MANTTFDGPVRSRNGFQSIGPGAVPALTAATDLTVADHAGRVLTMDPVGTPTAITIPAIVSILSSLDAQLKLKLRNRRADLVQKQIYKQ